MRIGGWGGFPLVDGPVIAVRNPTEARAAVLSAPSMIARGNGRAYGDAALSRHRMVSTLLSDRILAFDPTSGRITCEAGVMLADLLEFAVPRGFFPPVTPGTKFVTIGGMIAADVHGKNHHHAGTFGDHVESLRLLGADGQVRHCSPTEETELFAAVRGGMGLVGLILDATFRLLPIETPLIRQETVPAAGLAEVMALFEASADWTYSVAWIDCLAKGVQLGRSLLYRSRHVTRNEAQGARLAVPERRLLRVPFVFPSVALNRWNVRLFNELYYRRGKPAVALVDYDTSFYPLDALLDWNRIYGRNGFLQYQCVIPRSAAGEGLAAVLARVAVAGQGSFLAVLKLFGSANDAFLSFPLDGYTLTLDFPATSKAFNLMLDLDAIVADHGGRLYLAKDARMSLAMLRRGYPMVDRFMAVRAAVDPDRRFESLQSERLGL